MKQRDDYDRSSHSHFQSRARKRTVYKRKRIPLWVEISIMLVFVLIAIPVYAVLSGRVDLSQWTRTTRTAQMDESIETTVTDLESQGDVLQVSSTESPLARISAEERESLLADVQLKAVQYDYEGAIALLDSVENAENDVEFQTLREKFQNAQASLIAYPPTQVTHIFFHSLVVDTARAFSIREGNSGWNAGTEGFCEWMTTVDEFNRIMQQMYDRGYILISINDMVERTVGEDGVVHMSPKDIMIPEGKIPFVLSLDDLSYYHSYNGRGCATKMIIGEDGKPTCEYIDAEGNTLVGSYDCVPLLDDFIEEHPDFSYRGAKGTIALTGYNGILGYRTDYSYRDRVNLGSDQEAWLNANPDFDWDQECADAKAVADAIKEDGWTFASHTWGHMHIGDANMSRVTADTEKWLTYVKPLIGETDIIIFAHGQDLASWNEEYTSTEKFKYMKSQGFNVFCTVDSSDGYTVKFDDLYMKQGRRNLDGYRLWQSVFGGNDKTSDLYNANEVWDQTRPTDPELYDLK